MDRYPKPMFTAEQAAAGVFLLKKKRASFQKGVFWSTQAMPTAEQVAAGVVSWLRKKGRPF